MKLADCMHVTSTILPASRLHEKSLLLFRIKEGFRHTRACHSADTAPFSAASTQQRTQRGSLGTVTAYKTNGHAQEGNQACSLQFALHCPGQ
eukprot:1795912-Pleurochrysis_carterae.AAC.4